MRADILLSAYAYLRTPK